GHHRLPRGVLSLPGCGIDCRMHGADRQHDDEENRENDNEGADFAAAGYVVVVHGEILELCSSEAQCQRLPFEIVFPIARNLLADPTSSAAAGITGLIVRNAD